MPTIEQWLQVIGMLLFFALMAAIPAFFTALWYAVKVWFTTKIVKKTWSSN